MRTFWVYILGSHTGMLYVGVTGNLEQRLAEHQTGIQDGFTVRAGVHRLLYCERMNDLVVALTRERQLKSWSRARKIQLITMHNPGWEDLAAGV